MGADLASEFLEEPEAEKVREEVGEALGELQAVEESIVESAEEALAALSAIEPDSEPQHPSASESAPEIEAVPEAEDTPASESEYEEAHEEETAPEAKAEQQSEAATKPEPSPEPEPPPPPTSPPVVDWNRWQSATEGSRPAPAPRPELRPSVSDVGTRRFEAKAVMGAMGAEHSVLSQLRVLRRELSGFRGSSVATLRELIEAFPDGWARRRALCALFEEGIPSDASDGLELVSCLERELDRRWCLGVLARRGELRGSVLTRALDLVDSAFGKKRLTAAAS
jgi:hypothetical protein